MLCNLTFRVAIAPPPAAGTFNADSPFTEACATYRAVSTHLKADDAADGEFVPWICDASVKIASVEFQPSSVKQFPKQISLIRESTDNWFLLRDLERHLELSDARAFWKENSKRKFL